MHKISLACAVLSIVGPIAAQTCTSNPPPSSILTQDPFSANFYVGAPSPVPAGFTGFNLLVDVNVSADVTVTGLQTWLYDQGAGSPVNPDQTGLTAQVNIYQCANTFTGNETILPSAPGSPWTQIAANATVLIDAYPTNSIISLTPFVLTAGSHGLAFEFTPPDPNDPANQGLANAANAGPLHPLIQSPGAVVLPSDPFLQLQQTGFQTEAFVTGAVVGDDINLEIEYQAGQSAAFSEPYGSGCYDRPRMVFEEFAANSAIDLVGGSQTMSYDPVNDNYTISQGGFSYNTTLAGNAIDLTTLAYTASSSGNWDDATIIQTPTSPISFPGGSATTISINSNAKVYLGSIDPTDNSFSTHGAPYGSVAPFSGATGAGLPVLAAFNCDLDPTAGGTIWYEDPSPNGGVRITWDNVPNWQDTSAGAPAAVNNFIQMEFLGNIVFLSYGASLGNGGSGGNTAIVGFSAGNDEPVTPQVDWSALNMYVSGDGAVAPVLAFDNRPVVGTTPNLVTSSLSPGTVAGLTIISFQQDLAGTPLNSFGLAMPGCNAHVGVIGTSNFLGFPNAMNEISVPFPIPMPPPNFVGVVVYVQAGTQTPGFNNAGFLATNGLCFRIGF